MSKLSLAIDADWLNNHIADLVDEGRLSLAYQTAEACMVNPDISDKERQDLIMGVLNGTLQFADAGNGVFTLEETGKTCGYAAEMLIRRIESMQEKIEEQASEIDELYRKFLFVYDHLEPENIIEICDDYLDITGKPLFGEFSSSDSVENTMCYVSSVDDDGHPYAHDNADNDDAAAADIPEYGWLSPEGKFFAVEWGEHGKWAWEYVKDNKIESINGIFDAGDLLAALGWVLLHNPMHGTARATISKDVKLTIPQKRFLYEYYMSVGEPLAADAAKKSYMGEVNEFFDLI